MSGAAQRVLLDGNVLIALGLDGHVHREAARQWLAGGEERFATCPTTQGTLVRAWRRWSTILVMSLRSTIWGYDHVPLGGVVGHRQVTDAYLAQLARSRRSRLATFDRGLAAAHNDVATLISIS